MMKICFLTLFFFTTLWAEQPRPSGSHSLRYSFSLLSETLPGAPQYSVVGYVDDVPVIGYTSESGRAAPRAPWMERITDQEPQYWEEISETFEEVKEKLRDTLRNQMEQKNQAPGLHVFQTMVGCELLEDGMKWFERYAYDGSNYSSIMDTETVTVDRGNPEESLECMKDLKKILQYGDESLRRRVAPQTSASQRKTGDCTFLIGYAYGFYPRDIEVKWVQNGVEMPWESSEILPNPDGTYQVRATVEVQEGDDVKDYEFHVNHRSLPEIVTVTYDPPGKRWPGRVVLVVPALTLMAMLVFNAISLKCFAPDRAKNRERPTDINLEQGVLGLQLAFEKVYPPYKYTGV